MSDPLSELAADDPLSEGAADVNEVCEVHDTTEHEGGPSEKPGHDDVHYSQADLERELQDEVAPSSSTDNVVWQAEEMSRQDSVMSDYSDILAKIEEEMGSEPKDLDIVVEKPEKIVKTMESYIAFCVKTKTTRSDFENPEYTVRRRYNDFLWLRQQLEEKYPALIIPPLPEKHNLTIDRFDKEFVKFRQMALHRFMGRLAAHPITSTDSILKAFLTLETEDLQLYKKRGVGLLSRVTKSLSAMGGSYMLKNRGEEYSSLCDYAQSFADKMGAFERITSRVVDEQNDYLLSLSEYPAALQSWAAVETDLSDNLQLMSQLMTSLHDHCQEMVDEAPLKTLLPAKEYMLFAESMKSALTRRDAIQHELEVLNEELVKSSEEKKQMESAAPGSGGFLSRSMSEETLKVKSEKLSSRVAELESARNHCKARLDERNLQLKTDLERWHINKKADMKELIGGMATRHIQVYDKQIIGLEGALSELKKTITC